MYLNSTTGRSILIGTVYGGGYNCQNNNLGVFEGSTNGLWNMVSNWVKWIRMELIKEMGEPVCNA